jgi:hypothetical protein
MPRQSGQGVAAHAEKKTQWELAVAALQRAATRITTAKKRPDDKPAKAMLPANRL